MVRPLYVWVSPAGDRTKIAVSMSSMHITKSVKTKNPSLNALERDLYPAPESNRHGFPQVFETSASTNSASWAFVLDGVANVDNETLIHKIIFN